MGDRSDNATGIRAGLAKVELSTSMVGAELFGYPTREGVASAVHDPLFARTLVLESSGERVAICTLDLVCVTRRIAEAARERIARDAGIPPDCVFLSASHTHSAPFPDDASCWPEGLDATIAASVVEASQRLEEAEIGAGWGMVHGHTLNRRHLEDPVDPAVFVIRIDDVHGKPLGAYYGFACHPVVLGPDILQVSGDWVASCSEALESELGGDAVALYGPGAHGDVNPLTDGVRKRIAEARAVKVWIDGVSLVDGISYYGSVDAPAGDFNIGDRLGGTFAEMEELGRTVADEVLRVHRGITPDPVTGLWARRLAVRERLEMREDGAALWTDEDLRRVTVPGDPVEVMMIGIDGPGIVLVGQPGEIFGETGILLRRELRAAGIRHPFVVGYTNAFMGYFPPARAFKEGGYEVALAETLGVPETLQDEIQAAVLDAVRSRAPVPAGS